MPKKRQKDRIEEKYFVWLLGQRNGVWQADGRSNDPNPGRHSLGTKDRAEALRLIKDLDLKRAVELGRADRSLLQQEAAALVPLDEGRKKYLDHVARPPVLGGAAPKTIARYRAVFDKFAWFAGVNDIRYWQQVTNGVLERYGRWLDDGGYAGRSQGLELTTIKQAVKWMVREGMLPATCLLTTKVRKIRGTDTHCYSPEEVRAIIAYCRARDELRWLADIVIALARTGLRISELVELRWANVDLDRAVLHLRDTSRRARKSERKEAQTTKSHNDRTLTIHRDLLAVLRQLPRVADQRVFHGPRGGRLKPDTVRRILQRDVLAALAEQFPAADGRAGITAGRLHSFRHYFASTAANAGMSEQALMEFLGHQDSAMIRHYYHLRQDEARRQMEKLPSLGLDPGPSDIGSGEMAW